MITRVEEILTRVKNSDKRYKMVLACADSGSALETVSQAKKSGLADTILVGNRDAILKKAEDINLDISDFQIEHINDDPQEVVNHSLEMIKAGEADVIMKGQVATRTVLKGVLNKKFGFRTGRTLSHIGVFNVPGEERVLIISDAAVNILPDLKKKREILINAVGVAHALDIARPKVAMLSYIEEASDPTVSSTADADFLAKMSKIGAFQDCVVEGPYSLDVALSPDAAKIKGVEGEVAGCADVLITHDIGMGNVLYKALLLWCKPTIAGVLVGAKIPVVLTSRSDSMSTKLNSIALSVMCAMHNPK